MYSNRCNGLVDKAELICLLLVTVIFFVQNIKLRLLNPVAVYGTVRVKASQAHVIRGGGGRGIH